jgi:ADP-ribosylglycohydrolase
VRLTWVQPEDLIGHELRQAREQGKQVSSIEARWHAAGGHPAPARAGASEQAASPALRDLAERLLDEIAEMIDPRGDDEPDDPADWLPAAVARPAAVDRAALVRRIDGAWLGRAVGCVLGKPVEKLPRAAIRELLESAGRWPLDDWFSARGVPGELLERWPWNRRSAPTSLRETIHGIPEDDDLNFTLLALDLLERHGHGFTTDDVANAWLDSLPAGRVFTAERIALRNLLSGLEAPATATFRNPFREWIGARLRVELHGITRPGDITGAAAAAARDAVLSHTANGVYAATFIAGACAAVCAGASPAETVEAGLTAVPARSRLALAIAQARQLAASELDWEGVVDELERIHADLHWVHAINNTALVAAALCRFGSDFDGAVCGVVSAGLDTDTNGATVGTIVGAAVGVEGIATRWSEPLGDRLTTSLPGFDGVSLRELGARTLAVVAA